MRLADAVTDRVARNEPSLRCISEASPALLTGGTSDSSHVSSVTSPAMRAAIRVRVALFSQGINEKQTLANLLRTNVATQAAANEAALDSLADFHSEFAALLRVAPDARTAGGGGGGAGVGGGGAGGGANGGGANVSGGGASGARLVERQREALATARRVLRHPSSEKNVELLLAVAALSRLLGGGRLVMCESGIDLTAMAVTLEHGQILQAATP